MSEHEKEFYNVNLKFDGDSPRWEPKETEGPGSGSREKTIRKSVLGRSVKSLKLSKDFRWSKNSSPRSQ